MKYRLKQNLLWLKAGEILPNENSVLKPNFRCLYTIYRDNKTRYTESMEICPEEHPDFFEPISEEEEKDQEQIKRLESRGYQVIKKVMKETTTYQVTHTVCTGPVKCILCRLCDDCNKLTGECICQ